MTTPTMNPSELRTAEDFKRFFEGIPDEKWCTQVYIDDNGRCCAMGHLGPNTLRAQVVRDLFENILVTNAATVNDGDHPDFQQPTPKQRILAALDEIIAKEKKTV